MQLSKSDYMLYLRHPAWLWVKKHDKRKIPPVDDTTQAIFNAGFAFEAYAESLFEGGFRLGFEGFEEYRSLTGRTERAVAAGEQVLFQPRFESGNFTCICDIVTITDTNVVDIYEVKSSTRVKQEHILDLAFQVVVLEGAGYEVRDVYVIHTNNQYVRQGEIDAAQLTKTVQVTEAVLEHYEQTHRDMKSALAVARQTIMPDPDPARAQLGSKKDWMKVYENIFPQPPKVWPPDTAPTIDHQQIERFLGALRYPLYFFDYETMQGLVPYFDGQRPYQQIPFQYSIHVLHEPGGRVEHREYLHRENSDPGLAVVQRLVKDLDTEGSIIVWNQNFEKTRNDELGEMHPSYAEPLRAINERVVDLMIPFKAKWYDDPRFAGSASIKNVLPVLCPELSYAELGIQQGNAAQRYWMEAVLDGTRNDQKQQILDDLVEYCKLDTWAMVAIYDVLRGLAR